MDVLASVRDAEDLGVVTEHHAQPAPRQLSLFPEGHELQAQALAALSDLDVSRARRWLDRLRGQSRGLPNVQIIDAAVALLDSALPSGRSAEDLARALRMAHATWHEGRLSRAVAEFVDQTIARFWAKGLRGAAFLDAEQRVHRGVLDLVLGDVIAADRHLRRSLEGEFAHRADLWGYLGDAALARGRADQANACYVRALVLAPTDVDLLRIRMPALRQLH